MMFVSYAQNFEDVMLWRALRHVEGGFYIDVGAWSPVEDSVTLALYERGWHGINIEPNPEFHAALVTERPRDITLAIAVSDTPGRQRMYFLENPGLSTLLESVAADHQAAGMQCSAQDVPVHTLAQIWAEHVPPGQAVHVLKIDVEGAEEAVIRGHDWQQYRPWVVVVEATIPMSQERNHERWEPLLLEARYLFAFDDGINRFYLAAEHAALRNAFSHPPNFFDRFVPVGQVRANEWAEREIERADQEYQRAQAAEQWAQTAAEQAHMAELRRLDSESRLQAILNSRSWRWSAPARIEWQAVPKRWATHIGQMLAWARNWQHFSKARSSALAPVRESPSQGIAWHPQSWPMRGCLPNAAEPPPETAEQHFRVRLLGHIEGHYSLAVVNRGLVLGLASRLPGRVSLIPWHGQRYTTPPTDLPADCADRIRALSGTTEPGPASKKPGVTVSITHHFPLLADPEDADLRLALFFWEETSVPRNTVQQLNAGFDGILVASRSVARSLRDSGCTKPIRVIPMGIDHLVSERVTPIGPLEPGPNRRWRFLHVSSAFARKGADVLLAAYLDAFTADDPVELYIKTFPNPHNQVRAQWQELRASYPNPAKVVIDEAPLDDAGMLALYRSAQLLVLPTRGEGFNLPAAEALAMRLPVVVTGLGAHADFCTVETAYLIPCQYTYSKSHLRAFDACWLEPDAAALANTLRQCLADLHDQSPLLEQRRDRGRHWVRSTYRWEHTARAVHGWILERAQAHVSQPNRDASQHLIVFSSWNTRCGIAEYTQGLVDALPGPLTLEVHCETRTELNPAQTVYQPDWVIGDDASVLAALESLHPEPGSVLWVHHQPSLFNLPAALCARLAILERDGVRVFLELHSTRPLLSTHRPGQAALASLRRISRIVVHGPDDLNHLLALGLADNVMLTHLAIPATPRQIEPPAEPQTSSAMRETLGIPEDALVIGSFGFLLPHKGLDILIRALRPLAKAQQRPVRLLALNALLDQRSEETLAEYKRLAEKQGVAEWIVWRTEFQPIAQSLDQLAASDYIVFPYTTTQESASSAVTIGLASLRPVLVSPSPIFAHLADCTWRLADHGVDAVVAGIRACIEQPGEIAALLQRQSAWLEEHRRERIAERFWNVIDGLRHDRRDGIGMEGDRARQLLVDISELYFRDAGTGIQRVVHSILQHLPALLPANWILRPVYGTVEQGYRYTFKFLPDAPARQVLNETPMHWVEGDVFLGLDLSAHLVPALESTLASMRRDGVTLHYVVYDILPLTDPQFFPAQLTGSFAPWLRVLARQAHQLIGISAATADSVHAWLAEHSPGTSGYALPYSRPSPRRSSALPEPLTEKGAQGPNGTRDGAPATPAIGYFHLGTEFRASAEAPQGNAAGDGAARSVAGTHQFLMVGTLEPRKGHAQVLEAITQLWAQGCTHRLILVGKQGWMVDDLATQLRNHPERGDRLVWHERADDALLSRLYRESSALIAASWAEGFGLPLIEAAPHGTPILARDIPVFREVAGEHAFYFRAEEASGLAQAIVAWVALAEQGRHPCSTSMPYLSWEESTIELLQRLGITQPGQPDTPKESPARYSPR